MPKAALWQTPRQPKTYLDNKRKEKEAGEEREGNEDDQIADASDEDGEGNGGGQGDGQRARERAPVVSASWNEGMRVVVTRVEGEGVVGDTVLVGEGQGEISSGAPRSPWTTQED